MGKYIKIVLAFFSLLCTLIPSFSSADETIPGIAPNYRWGRGLDIPSLNLNIGGYFHFTFKQPELSPGEATLDDLSLFINWSPIAQFRFFSELEVEDYINSVDGVNRFSKSFKVERLYVDFLLNESFTLRFGQFLTPVGRWNPIHAAPLVWTTSRPLSTESESFPSHANGLMLTKQFIINQHDLDVSFYLDDSADIDPRFVFQQQNIDTDRAFQWAIGSYMDYTATEHLNIGMSHLLYKKRADKKLATNYQAGLDLHWRQGNYEVQSEWLFRTAADRQGSEFSGYLQGVTALGYNFFAIARYEVLTGTHQLGDFFFIDKTLHLGVPALAWRPAPPLILKAEYRFGENNQFIAPSGFFTSISMFF